MSKIKYKKNSPAISEDNRANKKLATTYSPTIMQYHRRDKA